MKNNYSKRPTRVKLGSGSEKRSDGNRHLAKPSRERGALNLQLNAEKIEKIDISKIIKKTEYKTDKKLPELLAPAGSLDALKAAIAAGADAIYFGGGDFNARINAKNFSNEEIAEAIKLLHSCGRKAYITLNTLVHNREIEEYLRFADFVYQAGADALIVADIGGAEAIHRHLPELELHASTQMSGHNLAEAVLLSKHGFSRMVCARELSREDMEYLVKNSPIETEAFVHGALCVCHSGQCLFSSIVGGRSGNRGACAQPCRLPYKSEIGKEGYPLSLKDLSLAGHVTELIDMGVHSLKIEGRMKSPEYVYGVVRAFRTLLDENKNATPEELSNLAKIFSRGGFTDGYYERKLSPSMLGIRSEEEKQLTKISLTSSERMDEITPVKKKLRAYARVVLGEPISLRLECEDASVTSHGQAPEIAQNAPLSADSIKRSLTKFGSTDFELTEYVAETDDNLMVPVSALNSLRRDAVEMLVKAMEKHEIAKQSFEKYEPASPLKQKQALKSARFYSPEQITDEAKKYFDVIYLPVQSYNGECSGIILPPVILDGELPKIEAMLQKAKELGAKYALAGNIGALELAKAHGFVIHGDFRFNVYNNESIAKLEALGVESIMLSPELTLPQIRDVKGDTAAIVYGRIPLMLLEKCVFKEISTCQKCDKGHTNLIDRRDVSFPVLREYEHRNVIYNSAPTYMADRQNDLNRAGIINHHFLFSIESPDEVNEVISAYKNSSPVGKDRKIRRI